MASELGTAPRRVSPGVWKTRTGRRLSPAGSLYWERKYRRGEVTAGGRLIRPSVVINTPPAAIRTPKLETGRPGQDRGRRVSTSEAAARALEHQLGRGALRSQGAARQAGLAIPSGALEPVRQVGEALGYSPLGVIYGGKALGLDLAAAVRGQPSFTRTRALARQLGAQVAEDVRHPIRNLGYLTVDVAGLGAPVLGAGARVSAAGRAASAARGAGRMSAAARAFRHPPVKPRTLTYVGEEGRISAELPSSRAASSRAVQRLHDLLAQRFAPGYVKGRIGKQIEQEQRFLGAAAQAPARALAKEGRKLTPAQETALRTVANGRTIDERIAFHRVELAKRTGTEADRIKRKITLLEKARPYVVDTPEGPKIAPTLQGKLGRMQRRGVMPAKQELYGRAQTLADEADRLAIESGRLSPEAAAARIQAPGTVIGGAVHKPYSVAEMFDAQQPTRLVGRRVESSKRGPGQLLAVTAGTATVRFRKKGGGVYTADVPTGELTLPSTGRFVQPEAVERPRTREEAAAELDRLERERETLIAQAVDQLKGGVGFERGETARRNLERARAQGRARGRAVEGRTAAGQGPQTLAQEFRDLAEQKLYETAEANRGAPWAEAFLANEARIAELRQGVHEAHPVFGESRIPERRPGTLNYDRIAELEAAGVPRDLAEVLTHAEVSVESFARDVREAGTPEARALAEEKLAGQERLLAERTAQAEQALVDLGTVAETVYGAPEEFTGGRFYVSETDQPRPGSLASVRAGWRGGFPRAKRTTGAYRKPYRGENLRAGTFRDETTELVARRHAEETRISGIMRLRDRILPAAEAEPAKADWVAVRLDNFRSGETPAVVRDYLERVQAGEPANPIELEAMADEVRHSIVYGTEREISRLSAEQQAEFQRLYDEGRIGWVDPKLFGGALRPPIGLGVGQAPVIRQVLAVIKEANAGLKTALISARPAYFVPNVLGNGLLLVVDQGVKAVLNMRRAIVAHQRLSTEAAQRFDALAGTGIFESVIGGGGPAVSLQALARAVSRVWSPLVDNPFRRASLLFYIQKEVGGTFSWAKVERFLQEAPDQTLVRVAQEGNAAMIDYGRMGPTERSLLREIIFIYPWMKGSFRYAGRIYREHPTQAALFTQLGVYAEGEAKKSYGGIPIPSWLKGTAVIGGGIVNPLSAGVLGTPMEALELMNYLRGRQTEAGAPSEFLTPAVRALADLAASRRPGAPPFSLTGFGRDVVEQTPQLSLYRRLTEPPSPTAVYQPRTLWEKLSPFMVGGLYPRPYSPDVVAKRGRNEARASMSPIERAQESSVYLHDQLLRAAKRAGLAPRDATSLPPQLERALDLSTARAVAYAKAGIRRGKPGYQQEAFAADVKLLRDSGRITAAKAERALAWGREQSDATLSRERRYLTGKYFGGTVVSDARTKIERAAFLHDVAELEQSGRINREQARKARGWAGAAGRTTLAAERRRVETKYGLQPVGAP